MKSPSTISVRKLHLIVGFLFAGVFLATGVYMAVGFPEINQDDHGMRMMFRSAHVYILMSALVNLVMGCYLKLQDQAPARRVQLFGSLLVLITPAIFLVAFFVEPAVGRVDRPIVIAGAAALGIGVILQPFVVLQAPRDDSS
ncbi:MAG: hypothetical protein ACR2NP_02435 [Pirellulaceae bacterium]